ncbi:MAG: 2OG-Fe(II) oxygenase [Gammaproteobacteria bacterium]|nr:2OG-Fe(II) oxygenase [Gammaproteobacteria bacterium]MBU1554661.1 2OG-Fe(II) oxygenase [Gammaproteobacteria bacterium]MBU2069124.1 2OG-Fe(II) oxygenase [Gammaproteobacteria bacterium]MBU2182621.1 2OG-Fe(II) oxygenase [Gammaproteobacteria bacterium]MBU2206548.1 2OG-Fe(II) oxygenase [Gammaproteobacteria bacterium]
MKIEKLAENIFTIASFLTPDECENFVAQAESLGFRSADVDTGTGRAHLTNIRNNERVDWVSEELAELWWHKLPKELFPTIENKHAIGLSPRFRFYKYSPGQKFNMHKDGRQDVDGNITMMTLIVYLNEGYQGGSTKFRENGLEIVPVIGKAIIFEHHIWHQGIKLESGIKYVLRTDIVFKS